MAVVRFYSDRLRVLRWRRVSAERTLFSRLVEKQAIKVPLLVREHGAHPYSIWVLLAGSLLGGSGITESWLTFGRLGNHRKFLLGSFWAARESTRKFKKPHSHCLNQHLV